MSDDPTDRKQRVQPNIEVINYAELETRILANLRNKESIAARIIDESTQFKTTGRYAGTRPPEMQRISGNQYLAQAHNAERRMARMMAGVRLSETGEVLDEDGRGTGVWIDV